MRKLINDGIFARAKANVVQTKAFSSDWRTRWRAYHANAITTAEVLQELIQLARRHPVRARQRGEEESGLSDEEIAFYDALAENESAAVDDGRRQAQADRPRIADEPARETCRLTGTNATSARGARCGCW